MSIVSPTRDEYARFSEIRRLFTAQPELFHEAGNKLDQWCSKQAWRKRRAKEIRKSRQIRSFCDCECPQKLVDQPALKIQAALPSRPCPCQVKQRKQIAKERGAGYPWSPRWERSADGSMVRTGVRERYSPFRCFRDAVQKVISDTGPKGTGLNLGFEHARMVLLITWLLTDHDAGTRGLGLTKFEKWTFTDERPSLYVPSEDEVEQIDGPALLDLRKATLPAGTKAVEYLPDRRRLARCALNDASERRWLELVEAAWQAIDGDALLADPIETAGGGKPTGPTSAADEDLDNEAKALGVLAAHPDWLVTQIAAAVGVNRTSLYRYPRFRRAREALREGTPAKPTGHKDAQGNVEAIDGGSGEPIPDSKYLRRDCEECGAAIRVSPTARPPFVCDQCRS